MLGQVFSTMGGFVGHLIGGGGMISTIMRFAGRSLGNYLEHSNNDPDEYYHTKYHLNNLYIHADTNGKPIPLIFGKARVAGHIIWATPIEEVAANSTDLRYFKGSGDIKAIHHNTEYLYYANFALALCEGVVSELNRMWINGVETDISEYTYRFYNGSEEQMPDPLIESSMGIGLTSAHRGLAYIVFEKLPLANFGGRIPGFSFEVTRKPLQLGAMGLEESIQSMIMIPGSGEFVYDTICQDKIIYSHPDNVELYREPINHHNKQNIANSIYSLNALQETCPNLEWVAPVVTWFADNLDAGNASVFPTVEYNDPSSRTTEEWSVGGFTRENARVISRSDLDIPNYGGSVNDASIVRYLKEIKSRGLKTMLYPMIFLDLPGKPWRGSMRASPEGIRRFFNHSNGYKKFILHYAHLTRGLVDAFVIGSEMKSLTKVRDGDRFPAVEGLIDLARQVKLILGPDVKVTYAADWSEYHHTDGGYYNMDALWACEAIDFIGIDAYFPLTNSTASDISEEEIKKGWQSGEGYEYCIDHASGQKHSIGPEWAWKNIEYWWKNHHTNYNGIRTDWVPRSKKIWFTEFGFPSIDKASNQPNVFFDPDCFDGGAPKYSTAEVDFAIQRKSIKATLDFWRGSEFLERAFLWTWDARPYPAWPHGNVWADGAMWLRGHWINGKLGVSNMANIILELCMRGGIDPKCVNVDTIDEVINGVVFTKQSSIWDVISLMRLGYFFDVRNTYSNKLDFIKRGSYAPIKIDAKDLVRDNNGTIQIADITEENILAELSISFPDESQEYCYNIVQYGIEVDSNRAIYYLNLPIIMDEKAARNLSEKIIYSARSEDKIFKFTMTIEYLMRISPGDVVVFVIHNHQYRIRVTDIKYSSLLIEVLGIFDYEGLSFTTMPVIPNAQIASSKDEYFELFELPESLYSRFIGSIYAATSKKASLYAVLNDKTKIADLNAAEMGVVRAVMNNEKANEYVVDEVSLVTIFSYADLKEPSEYIPAMIGNELVYFRYTKRIAENLYQISSFIRGAKFTEIAQHQIGERFVILNNVSEIPVSDILENMDIKFSAIMQEKSLNFKGLNKKSIKIKDVIMTQNGEIRWKGRLKNIDGWRDSRHDLEYRIMHESAGAVQEFYTKNNIFLLEGISADSKIGIITMQKGFAESEIVYIN